MPQLKYIFTSEQDALITEVYKTKTGRGEVRDLSKLMNIPRWKITKRARNIGAFIPLKKAENWSAPEIEILKEHAHKQPECIMRHLRRAGFDRTSTSIILKRKRLDLLSNLEGYSATGLAKCFGVDIKMITGWIGKEYLSGERRGTARTEKQGGDNWYIKKSAVRSFLFNYIELVDFRKIDKFWMIDLVKQQHITIVGKSSAKDVTLEYECSKLHIKLFSHSSCAAYREKEACCSGCPGPERILT